MWLLVSSGSQHNQIGYHFRFSYRNSPREKEKEINESICDVVFGDVGSCHGNSDWAIVVTGQLEAFSRRWQTSWQIRDIFRWLCYSSLHVLRQAKEQDLSIIPLQFLWELLRFWAKYEKDLWDYTKHQLSKIENRKSILGNQRWAGSNLTACIIIKYEYE